jgi:LmbE family N-acetylglucosaminyl deacetylase
MPGMNDHTPPTYPPTPPPDRAALMLVLAHPDDEAYCGGAIPYYALVRRLPVLVVIMTRTAWIPHRCREMHAAMRRYGLPYDAVIGPFADCGFKYPDNLDYVWRRWAGEDHEDALEPFDERTRVGAVRQGRAAAVGFVAGLIRRHRPLVILTHDLAGEYGHTNHIAVAQATVAAFERAADPDAFAEQLTGADALRPWQASKLYVHLHEQHPHMHDWDMSCAELAGLAPTGDTPVDVMNWGLKCHVSQSKQGDHYVSYEHHDPRRWGLYATTVGPDVAARNDFFENVEVGDIPPAPPPPRDASCRP